MPDHNDAALELEACTPRPIDPAGFNPNAVIPLGCETKHIRRAMQDFQAWLGLVNSLMHERQLPRLETMLMPANFSSIVGEFAVSSIPKYCPMVVKNAYHNGHPDLIPAGRFENDMCQHGHEGIEVKGSRYLKSWQGHNPEDTWLMVFVFESGRPNDRSKNIPPAPFRFRMVLGAELKQADWLFAGRTGESRRTITASVGTPPPAARLPSYMDKRRAAADALGPALRAPAGTSPWAALPPQPCSSQFATLMASLTILVSGRAGFGVPLDPGRPPDTETRPAMSDRLESGYIYG